MKAFGIGTAARVERRATPFISEEAKFSTQNAITFYVITIMALVTAWVLFYGSIEQRSAVVQMWIGLSLLTAGFWFATTKSSADKDTQMNKMIAPTAAPGTTTITPPSNIIVTTTEGATDAKP